MSIVCNSEKTKRTSRNASTLCTDEDHGDLSCVPVAGQAQEIIVHRLEADLIFQAEDENHRIDPGGELKMEQMQSGLIITQETLCYFCTGIKINVLCCAVQCRVRSRGLLYTSDKAELKLILNLNLCRMVCYVREEK